MTRTERRRAAERRRHRTMLVGSSVLAVAVMAAWFPASELLHQHEQLAAATTELHRLDRTNSSLKQQEARLDTPSEVGRIAQQEYDLVSPGDQAYQVLPASSSGGGTVPGTSGGSTGAGQPGANAASGGTAGSTSGGRAAGVTGNERTTSGEADPGSRGGATSGSFLSRVVQTLEFWR